MYDGQEEKENVNDTDMGARDDDFEEGRGQSRVHVRDYREREKIIIVG